MDGPGRARGALRGAEVAGLLLIGLGVLFLLNQFGWIRFGLGLVWPILLIGVGALLVVGAAGRGSGASGQGETTLRVPREDSDQLQLDLRIGAGHYVLGGGGTSLVDADSRSADIDATVRRSGRRAHVRLALDRPWFPFREHGTPDWRIAVGDGVATRLDVAAGAGDFDFDLSGVRLVDARLSIGASQARITLPRPIGEVPIRVSTGASQLTIAVPAGVEMQVLLNGGLLDVEGPVQSAGYATATDRVSVRVDGGAASVRIV